MTDWETTGQLAARVNRHPGSVRRAAEAGLLHGHQTGPKGRWSFRPEAGDAWIAGQDGTAACGCRQLHLVRKSA